MATYQTILTNIGTQKLAAAIASGNRLKISVMALGDGNGAQPTLDPAATALTHEVNRGAVNSLLIDPDDPSKVLIERVIGASIGGFWIREIGLYDDAGDLVAIGTVADTYKPDPSTGVTKTQIIQSRLSISSKDVVISVDDSAVFVTREYIDQLAEQIELAGKQFARKLVDAVLPIGTKIDWPLDEPPPQIEGIVFLKQNGGAFDPLVYPELAKVFPNNRVPDTRGDVIRGWDDARGVDSGRVLLSHQDDAFQDHAHTMPTIGGISNDGVTFGPERNIFAAFGDGMAYVGPLTGNNWSDGSQSKIYTRADGKEIYNNDAFVSAAVAPGATLRTYMASSGIISKTNPRTLSYPRTATETRMKNTAYNFIVRAA